MLSNEKYISEKNNLFKRLLTYITDIDNTVGHFNF